MAAGSRVSSVAVGCIFTGQVAANSTSASQYTICLPHSCCALLCYKAACCEHEDTIGRNVGYSSSPALAAVI